MIILMRSEDVKDQTQSTFSALVNLRLYILHVDYADPILQGCLFRLNSIVMSAS
jgi:hypothetical protein